MYFKFKESSKFDLVDTEQEGLEKNVFFLVDMPLIRWVFNTSHLNEFKSSLYGSPGQVKE